MSSISRAVAVCVYVCVCLCMCISPCVYVSLVRFGNPFRKIENIRNFVVACRAFGVPSHKLVDVTCVHEMTDTPHVVECVVSQ